MMPRTRTGTRRTGRTGKTMSAAALRPVAVIDAMPKRGVKLKHVSTFVMLVALLCLFAYLAGRVDVSAATSAASTNAPGVTRASLAPARADDSKEPNMFLGLRTVKYEVQDMAKAKEWYGKVFGLQPYFDEPAYYVGYNIGGYELGLVPEAKAATKRDAAGVAYWGVEDIRSSYKRLLDLGATSVSEVQDVGGGILVAEVRDPFGNVLGIIYNPHFKVGETK
jgi:predicted enzyme related to lactoylglutathione lyase